MFLIHLQFLLSFVLRHVADDDLLARFQAADDLDVVVVALAIVHPNYNYYSYGITCITTWIPLLVRRGCKLDLFRAYGASGPSW